MTTTDALEVSDAGETSTPASRPREFVIAGIVGALGILTFVLTSAMHVANTSSTPTPKWWPTILGCCLVAGGIALAAQAILKVTPLEEPTITRSGVGTLLLFSAMIVAYGFVWYYIDFRVVTPFLICGMVFVAGGRGFKALVIFPIVVMLILYGLFAMLLRVPL
ncbi:tripartite tricarboxylate transporter TctB family protein [Microbacterium gubbeenense]|uniref:tripartite tricarboxylate transporter TctB family protein n=1 Tax=Microbacterium gubbeenense TaxID=159896 RepID=UPI003F97F80F